MTEPQEWQRLAWAMGAQDFGADEPPDGEPGAPSFREWAERVRGQHARDFIAHTDALARIRRDAMADEVSRVPGIREILLHLPSEDELAEKVGRALYMHEHATYTFAAEQWDDPAWQREKERWIERGRAVLAADINDTRTEVSR